MQNKITFIYKITSPSDKIYIGSTFNIKHRVNQYKNLHCKFQTKLKNSILKYGWDNHIFEIIEECVLENRNEREVYWGNHFEVLTEKGLNCKLPKSDEIFNCISEETRKKMSEWQIGRKMSNEAKEKMSISAKKKFLDADFRKKHSERSKGKIISEETRLKISKANKGKKLSQETKDKIRKTSTGKKYPKERCNNISKALKGKKHTEKTRKNQSERMKKPVFQYSLEGLLIKKWKSYRDAAIELDIKYYQIRDCCQGKKEKYNNYIWKYN